MRKIFLNGSFLFCLLDFMFWVGETREGNPVEILRLMFLTEAIYPVTILSGFINRKIPFLKEK